MLGSQHSYHKRLNGCRTVALQQPGKEGFIFFSSNVSPPAAPTLLCSPPAGELVTPRKISRGKKTKKVESSFMLHLRRITTASLLGCGQGGKCCGRRGQRNTPKKLFHLLRTRNCKGVGSMIIGSLNTDGTYWGEILDKILNLLQLSRDLENSLRVGIRGP